MTPWCPRSRGRTRTTRPSTRRRLASGRSSTRSRATGGWRIFIFTVTLCTVCFGAADDRSLFFRLFWKMMSLYVLTFSHDIVDYSSGSSYCDFNYSYTTYTYARLCRRANINSSDEQVMAFNNSSLGDSVFGSSGQNKNEPNRPLCQETPEIARKIGFI